MLDVFKAAEARVVKGLQRRLVGAVVAATCGAMVIVWCSVSAYTALAPILGPTEAALALATLSFFIVLVTLTVGKLRRRRKGSKSDPLFILLGALLEFRDVPQPRSGGSATDDLLAEMLAELVQRAENRG